LKVIAFQNFEPGTVKTGHEPPPGTVMKSLIPLTNSVSLTLPWKSL